MDGFNRETIDSFGLHMLAITHMREWWPSDNILSRIRVPCVPMSHVRCFDLLRFRRMIYCRDFSFSFFFSPKKLIGSGERALVRSFWMDERYFRNKWQNERQRVLSPFTNASTPNRVPRQMTWKKRENVLSAIFFSLQKILLFISVRVWHTDKDHISRRLGARGSMDCYRKRKKETVEHVLNALAPAITAIYVSCICFCCTKIHCETCLVAANRMGRATSNEQRKSKSLFSSFFIRRRVLLL